MAKRDIGTRISLDGEAEFKSAVKNIDQELRVLASEMGAATSAFDKNNISVSDLQTKNEIYQKQIEVQKQKLSEQNRMLEECRAAQEKAAAAVSEAAKKYGEQSDEAKKAEEKLALVNSKLADYQISANSTTKAINQLEAAQKSNNEEIEKLQNADLDNITNDVKKLGDEAAESSDKWSKFRSGIVSAAKAAAAAVTAATAAVTAITKAVIDSANETAEYGDAIDKASQKIGVSAKFYQEWEAVLQHSGTSMDNMSAAFKTLANASQNASAKQQAAFESLGLSMEQVSSMSAEELFSSVVSGLQGMEESTERTALAITLLGKGAQELGPLLNTSAEDTQAMIDTVNNLGGVMSNDAVKASAAYEDSLQDLKTVISGAKRSLTADFLPGITTVMNGLTALFTGDKGGIETVNDGIKSCINKITSMLPEVLTAGVDIVNGLIGAITDNLPMLTQTATTVIISLADGLITSLPVIVSAAMQMIETLASGIAEALPELIPTIVDVVLSVTEMLIDNVDMLIDAAVAIITGLADGLIDSLPILLEKLPEIIGKLVSALMEAIPELIGAAVEIFFKIRTASEEMIPLIIDTIAGMIAEIGLAIANGAKAWVESFEDLGGKIFDWVQNLKTKMREAFDSIIGNIKEAIQPALDIGKNIIDGIVDGIKERVTAVKDKVKNACSELLGDVKEFFGIHSPSTVFKEQIGENLAAGLSEGFVEKMGKLSDDMDDAVPSDYKIGINITDTSSAKKAIDTIVKDYQDGLLNKAQYDKLYTKTLNECVKKQINITEYANQKVVAADKKLASARQKNVLSIAKTQIDSIVKAYKDGEISLKEMEQLYTQVYKTCADERVEIEEYAGEKITAVRKEVAKKNLEQLQSDIKSQISEYEKQLEDIKKSSDSYASKIAGDISDLYTFSTDEQTGKVTADLGNGIAQKQQQLNKYYSDLQKLLDKGVSEEMLAQLADMSFDKGAAIAESWAKMDSAQLKNLENSFAGLTGTSKKIGTLLYSKQSEQVAGAMIDSLRTTIESSKEFADIGKNIMDGIIGGINGGDINSRLKEACDGIVNAFKDYFGIHSPSRLFRDEVGAYLAEGLGEGFTAQMHNVTKAMQNAVPTDLGSIDANVNIKSGSANSFGAGQGGITFNQYNNSPKALSRAEIARDTRRGLQLASLI